MPFEFDTYAVLAQIRSKQTRPTDVSRMSLVSQGPCVWPPFGSEAWDAVEERAAIMEFDGGLPRNVAERLALATIDAAVPREV